MQEAEFHRLADAELTRLSEALEEADEKGELELEIQAGVMSIALMSGKEYIISKHAPSQQLWLSSPISGGLHFRYDGGWKLVDGRALADILSQELHIPIS